MSEKTYHCVVCGKKVSIRFYVCSECEQVYGKRKNEWPGWLRFLVNDAAKERMRTAQKYYDHEDCFTDLGLDMEGKPYED